MASDKEDGVRRTHHTAPGYSTLDGDPTPRDPVQAHAAVTHGDAKPPSEHPARKTKDRTPLIEIEVVHEHGPAPTTDRPWRTVEIWTRNRVYSLDSTLVCYEVTDRGTRKAVEGHPFIGLRLVGGQHREGQSIELSYPFPRPGTEAVFEQVEGARKAGGFSRTSGVARVILRLHIVTVSPRRVVPTWEEISGSFQSPAMKKDD